MSMKLYDDVISRIYDITKIEKIRHLDIANVSWKETDKNSIILRNEMAFELGCDGNPSVGFTVVTDNEDLISEDEVCLIGPDLSDIKGDGAFARIAVVKTRKDTFGESEKLYSAIRNLEYTRYHFYPEGFMIRIFSGKQKESVRISKNAIDANISFAGVGKLLIDAFKRNPDVECVKIIYITDESFDYEALSQIAKDSEKVTRALDHISNNVAMDCSVCNLSEVCDEVEGLRELHFANT